MTSLLGAFKPPAHRWRDDQNRWWEFDVYPENLLPAWRAGIYIMARARSDGLYDPLYIGSSSDVEERLSDHPVWLSAWIWERMTHVHLLSVPNKAQRFEIEASLIRNHPTPLNKQNQLLPTGGVLGQITFGSLANPLFSIGKGR